MGIPLEKIIGIPFIDFVVDNDKPLFNELFSLSWNDEIKTELFLASNLGINIPFLLSFAILELEEGPSLSIILTDLTELKDAEQLLKSNNYELESAQNRLVQLNIALEDTVTERTQELEISRERFKLLANSMPQMSWTNQPNGEVDFYNNRWYEYTGMTFKDTKSWGWQDMVHPDDLPITMERYRDALNNGHAFEVENRYRNVNGDYRWHLNRGVPLKNDLGEIYIWVCTATDINDQKRAMAKKDEFIGIASHELKTPLTSLKGYLQLIAGYKKQELPAIVQQFVARANEASNKLVNLVNDLLDVSKIQAGKLEFVKEQISAWQLLSICEDNASLIYPDFEFKFDFKEDYFFLGNLERLEQVIMNFVSNAVKYGAESKKIILSAHLEDNNVVVGVQDFGLGLNEEDQNKIFQRFYRVEDNKFQASGLGMGLFISSEIIKVHGGRIGVKSKYGKGSTFYFSLPAIP